MTTDPHNRWTKKRGQVTCQFAGDTLEFDQSPSPLFWHWSVYHGRLTFRASPGFSYGNFAYHPWHKYGT